MTRFHELPDGARLAYDDAGKGRPVVLIHGVCMSRRFFERNTGPLAERFRVVNVDLRGHGESPASEGGHTVAQYAQDVKHLLDTLALEDAVLVGWSMGTFVIWDLVRQFGSAGIAAHVNVSQGPSDLNRDGWELGIFPLEELFGALAAAQDDFRGFMDHFVPAMLMHPPSLDDHAALLEETQRIGANAGTCILLDQSLRDYRELVATCDLPTLLVWGADEKVVAAANGSWLQARQPKAELVVFEESGHCPMWEEPERFNEVVGDWIDALGTRS
jgi:pimeloyl-ACP methyl ester carboxylesterase